MIYQENGCMTIYPTLRDNFEVNNTMFYCSKYASHFFDRSQKLPHMGEDVVWYKSEPYNIKDAFQEDRSIGHSGDQHIVQWLERFDGG